MLDQRIVVTGIGVLSSLGAGAKEHWKNLTAGHSGICLNALCDVSKLSAKTTARAADYDPEVHLGGTSTKFMNRSTQMGLVSARMAFLDSKLEPQEDRQEETGLAVGVTHGHLASMSGIYKSIRRNPLDISPMDGPNGIVNIIASRLAIDLKTRAFNTTISTGFTASADAIVYGCQAIRSKLAHTVVVGGVESFCHEHFRSLDQNKLLSREDHGRKEISAPFDRRRNGFVYGEGSAFLVLEDRSRALGRKAKIYGEVRGYAKARAIGRDPAAFVQTAVETMKKAVSRSGASRQDIDYVSASANSSINLDKMEAQSISTLFGSHTPVGSMKGATGECISASGAIQAANALIMLKEEEIPPMINYEQDDPEYKLNLIVRNEKKRRLKNILMNNLHFNGCMTSIVFSGLS